MNITNIVTSALIVTTLVLAGCGASALRSASSGEVGCSPQEIEIADDEGGWGTRTWTATCHGKRFFCSAVAGGSGGSTVACKAAEEAH